jgi:AcrR family transcriptional regulator
MHGMTDAAWRDRVLERSIGPATRRSIDRGAALVTAARTLLERTKGDGFTVQDVADEAGQSLRSFYRHFSSKDDLLLAVLEEVTATYVRGIEHAIAVFDDPGDRLAAALFAAVRFPYRNEPGHTVGLSRLHLELAKSDRNGVAAARAPVAELLRDLVAAAGRAGRIDSIDPEMAGHVLMGLTATYVINRTLGNEYGLRLPTVEEHVTFCLLGLGAQLEPGWDARFAAVGV